MFKSFAKNTFIKMQLKEANSFLSMLKAMDADELGLVVAMTADVKNQFAKHGIYLTKPLELHAMNPNFVVEMVEQVKALQKAGQSELCSGFIVWITSLRAGNDFKLRNVARQVWGQLERGFPHVDRAVVDAQLFLPNDLNIDLSLIHISEPTRPY